MASYARCMIDIRDFGTLSQDGREVQAFTLTSETGHSVTVLSYGATLQALHLPCGTPVALGHEQLSDYMPVRGKCGSFVGRNANRIVGAQFTIDGVTSHVPVNDGANNLHTGPEGFHAQLWDTKIEGDALILTHVSPDGHQGFPGDVRCKLRVVWVGATLRLEITATTTQPGPVNPTWHPYFNLDGVAADRRIDGHDLRVDSDHRTTLDTAAPIALDQTRFDFRESLPLGSVRLDDNYAACRSVTLGGAKATLTVTSSLPDCQIYTGDQLPIPRTGVAIEPQFRPDDVNREGRSILRPGDTYAHWIEYSFA